MLNLCYINSNCYLRLRMKLLILSVIGILMPTHVSGISEYYKKLPSFDGLTSMYSVPQLTRSLSQCAQRCLNDTFCKSFFYSQDVQQYCHLVNTIMSDPNINTTTTVGATYYVPHIPQTQPGLFGGCQANDDIFRTVTLSDNTLFTFRVMRFYANETDATQGCIYEGAFLAKVLTQAKFDFIRHLLNCTGYDIVPYYRIDGTNHGAITYDYTSFVTVDGDIIPGTFWSQYYYYYYDYYYYNVPIYNCILMSIYDHWYFIRSPCDYTTYYICEK